MPHLQVSDISAVLTSLLPRLASPCPDSPTLFAQLESLIHVVFRHLADLFFAAFLTSFLAHTDFEARTVSAKIASDKRLRNKGKRKVCIRLLGGHLLTLKTTVVSWKSASRSGRPGSKHWCPVRDVRS
jgi:hypothetical protein